MRGVRMPSGTPAHIAPRWWISRSYKTIRPIFESYRPDRGIEVRAVTRRAHRRGISALTGHLRALGMPFGPANTSVACGRYRLRWCGER